VVDWYNEKERNIQAYLAEQIKQQELKQLEILKRKYENG
jgi:hypothetical protein